MKRLIYHLPRIVLLAVLAGFILSGCAQQPPAPTSVPTQPAAAPTKTRDPTHGSRANQGTRDPTHGSRGAGRNTSATTYGDPSQSPTQAGWNSHHLAGD